MFRATQDILGSTILPKVTVVINNRNLLTWPKEMVSCIEQFDNLHEIVIVDNDSTYEPLLQWYREIKHRVIRLDRNIGHRAPFTPEILSQIGTDHFVVTDPDLGLLNVPKDALIVMQSFLDSQPVEKVGLSLEYRTVPKASPYYKHVNTWEKHLHRTPLIANGLRQSPVDTTFAMYSKKKRTDYFIGGARMDWPYIARHYPWEVIVPDAEFKYYLDRANGSSSYTGFVNKHD